MNSISKEALERVARIYKSNKEASQAIGVHPRSFARSVSTARHRHALHAPAQRATGSPSVTDLERDRIVRDISGQGWSTPSPLSSSSPCSSSPPSAPSLSRAHPHCRTVQSNHPAPPAPRGGNPPFTDRPPSADVPTGVSCPITPRLQQGAVDTPAGLCIAAAPGAASPHYPVPDAP